MPNPASLDRLVLDHMGEALRFATKLVGDPDRAEEVVQEALVRVVRSWASFRGAAKFRTWFFRIVINVFRDRLAATQLTTVQLTTVSLAEELCDPIDDAQSGPPQVAMAFELSETIAREVSRLPPRQREVLVLITYEGLSVGEVAKVTNISEASVYSNLSAARARLKLRLAPYLGSVGN